jgi:hypothetical protein
MLIALTLLATAFAETPNARQQKAIDRCLDVWQEHPFGDSPQVRILSPSVRVLGLGSDEIREKPTEEPELVLVEPSVNVLTKTTWYLDNPNGWYCFNGNVGVLSKIVFEADCSASLADSRSGAQVIGRSETNGGIVVLGDVEVKRACQLPDKPASEAAAPADLPKAE